MCRRIEITTGARLHFGLFSHAPTSGLEFGGVGLMVASPGFQVVVEPSQQDVVKGDEQYRDRVRNYLARFRESQPHLALPACQIHLVRTFASHSGLGSGTQLGMAVSSALSILAGDQQCNAAQLAQRVNRGVRSAIGLHGFVQGGFLIDGGKAAKEEISPLTARVDFPRDWRVVLATPTDAEGLSGTQEENAFAELPGMPAFVTERLRQTIDEDVLPAVRNAEFARFSESIYEFGRVVGEYFAPEQGGIFAMPRMNQLAEELRAQGIRGVGQSSWGPTLFAFTENEQTARQLVRERTASPAWNSCKFQITAAMNEGAHTKIEK